MLGVLTDLELQLCLVSKTIKIYVNNKCKTAKTPYRLGVHSNTLNYNLTGHFLGMQLLLASGDGCRSLIAGECPAVPNNYYSYVLFYTVPEGIPRNV